VTDNITFYYDLAAKGWIRQSHKCDAFLPNEAYVADSKVEQQAFICVKGVVW